jgi:aminoglycoside phosphotransferase (APT) family kinase protein
MRCEIDTMMTEVSALKLLATIEQLPIPRIYVHDDSLTLLPVEYFIMEHLEGSPYSQVKASLSDSEKEKIEHQLGVLSRVINELKGESFGLFSQATFPSWKEAFRDMIYGLLADGRDAGVTLPITYPELKHEIEIRLDVLDEVKEPRLVHWDLWDGNVFVKDGEITGLIDFERALWGDPLMEYYFSHFTPSPAFRQGYGLFLTEPSQLARRELYDLYFDLILYIECAYRKYNNKEHVKWTYDNLVIRLEHFRS